MHTWHRLGVKADSDIEQLPHAHQDVAAHPVHVASLYAYARAHLQVEMAVLPTVANLIQCGALVRYRLEADQGARRRCRWELLNLAACSHPPDLRISPHTGANGSTGSQRVSTQAHLQYMASQ